jgi:predicted adenine nucleotide alpha hydrolase (AANH) superfamily ATPase
MYIFFSTIVNEGWKGVSQLQNKAVKYTSKNKLVYVSKEDYIITGKYNEIGGVTIRKIEHFNTFKLQNKNKVVVISPNKSIESVEVYGKKYTKGETVSYIQTGFSKKVEAYTACFENINFLETIKKQKYTGKIKSPPYSLYTTSEFVFRNGFLKCRVYKSYSCISKQYFNVSKTMCRFEKNYIAGKPHSLEKRTGGVKIQLPPPPKQTIISYLSKNDPYFRIHLKLRSHVKKIN